MIIDDYGISVDFVERWKDLSYLSLSIRVLFRHSLDASFESLSKFNTYRSIETGKMEISSESHGSFRSSRESKEKLCDIRK